ncbi:MAG: lysylphosphatidylglycerol synthase transmembrane domain-containing protein [Chloroflexota bacterium]
MTIFTTRRIWGVLFLVAIAVVGVLVASAAAGALRQSVLLSLKSGILNPRYLLMLVPFAAWSYGLRIIRWHTLIRRLVPGLPLKVSGYSQVVGFAFSATPGRIAELYKLKLIERSTHLPVVQSLPAAIVERVTDIVAFALLILIGGIFNWSGAFGAADRWIAVGVGLAALLVIYQVGRRVGWKQLSRLGMPFWRAHGARWSRRVPGFARLASMLGQLWSGGSKVANPSTVALALGCVVVGRLGDGVILWQITRAVGYPVPFTMALLMIGSAGLVGGITFSPGGIGAAEATLVGLIVAHGAPLGAALVTAFGARALIFWLWVVIGLLVFVVSHGSQIVGWVRPGSSRKLLAQPEERM